MKFQQGLDNQDHNFPIYPAYDVLYHPLLLNTRAKINLFYKYDQKFCGHPNYKLEGSLVAKFLNCIVSI